MTARLTPEQLAELACAADLVLSEPVTGAELPDEYYYEVGEAYAKCVEALPALIAAARNEAVLRGALEAIRDLVPKPYRDHPADWVAQIDACPECQSYRHHPIQRGICNAHRRPLWDRENHDAAEIRAIGYRAKSLAREALDRTHASDCATNNAPALPAGPCDCGAS